MKGIQCRVRLERRSVEWKKGRYEIKIGKEGRRKK
jgi:hypothetical protein